MKIEPFSQVALSRDVADQGLRRGDVATVVEALPGTAASGGEAGYVLEVFNAIGETIAVVTVPASAIEPLRASEVLSVRPIQQSK